MASVRPNEEQMLQPLGRGCFSSAVDSASALLWFIGSELEAASRDKQDLLKKLEVPSSEASPKKRDRALRVEDLRVRDPAVSEALKGWTWLDWGWSTFFSPRPHPIVSSGVSRHGF